MRQLRPQKFGTQFVPVEGQWRLWDLDPSTTDEERAAWDVQPPEEAERLVRETSGDVPEIDPSTLPDWARAILERATERVREEARPDGPNADPRTTG